ncbi:hypothetical protein, partial [Mesorhizobium sp. M1A.F.Ca.IN.022.04.1.1]|uniref:hypothetical protein n=1 Tax=Mesorhizobium sp. M1A.F.Ca.IN.022.04.1.1 TaxID=2496773 RepID=UPI0019D15E03
ATPPPHCISAAPKSSVGTVPASGSAGQILAWDCNGTPARKFHKQALIAEEMALLLAKKGAQRSVEI